MFQQAHLLSAGIDSVLCVDEIKFVSAPLRLITWKNLLALGCLYPGASTLVTNLFQTFPKRNSKTARFKWLREYSRGASHDVFRIACPRRLVGLRFSAAVEVIGSRRGLICKAIYDDCRALLLGAEVKHNEQHVTLINPSALVMTGKEHLLLLAADAFVANTLARAVRVSVDVQRSHAASSAATGADEISQASIERYLPKPVELAASHRAEVTLRTAAEYRGHIVVCGWTPSLVHFFRHLRSPHLASLIPIVVLDNKELCETRMTLIGSFEDVFYVQVIAHPMKRLTISIGQPDCACRPCPRRCVQRKVRCRVGVMVDDVDERRDSNG